MKKKFSKDYQTQNNDQEQAVRPAPKYLYLVRNPHSNETYVCGYDELIQASTKVLAPTRYGLDIGVVQGLIDDLELPGCGNAGCSECEKHYEYDEAFDKTTGEDESAANKVPEKLNTEIEDHSEEDDTEIPDASEAAGNGHDDQIIPDRNVSDQNYRDDSFSIDEELDEPQVPLIKRIHTTIKIQGNVDWIERIADAEDLAKYQLNCDNEDVALRTCREKVLKHGLDMKLVSAHYLLGEPKILFFFTADSRVDFRELVKDLVAIFRVRIELRQIGVRDESRVLGGLAVCGRDYCCHCVTDKLNPVSIKMAKEQNLSLNSMKISGPCGRLLCCLSYEYDFYKEEKRKLPSEGSRLKLKNELLKITEVNILSKKISLTAPDGRYLSIPLDKVFFNKETDRWEIDNSYIEELLSS